MYPGLFTLKKQHYSGLTCASSDLTGDANVCSIASATKETEKLRIADPLWEPDTGLVHSQKSSNAVRMSMSWRLRSRGRSIVVNIGAHDQGEVFNYRREAVSHEILSTILKNGIEPAKYGGDITCFCICMQDGLAPQGAKTFADTEVTKLGSSISTRQLLEMSAKLHKIHTCASPALDMNISFHLI